MRTDEYGRPCPSTLGEYRDLCAALGGEGCPAVMLLDQKIAREGAGRDATVVVDDLQMRMLLMPLLVKEQADRVPVSPGWSGDYGGPGMDPVDR